MLLGQIWRPNDANRLYDVRYSLIIKIIPDLEGKCFWDNGITYWKNIYGTIDIHELYTDLFEE